MSSLCINYELMFLYLSVSLNSWNHFMCLVAQLCLTLCDPMDYSPPGFSVHGIFQSKILERVAMPSSRGSSQPRDTTQVFCIAGRFFTTELSGKPLFLHQSVQLLSHVRLLATPWTAAHQVSLSITNFCSLLKIISIESVMPSNYLILCCPLLLLPSIFPSIRVF